MTQTRTSLMARLIQREQWIKFVSGAFALSIAFSLGIQTSDDIHPFYLTRADYDQVAGDMNGDGLVTIDDAIRALDVALGYEEATDTDRAADPNDDQLITVEDALTILKIIR